MTIYKIKGTCEECIEKLSAMCSSVGPAKIHHIIVSEYLWHHLLLASRSSEWIWQPHENLPPSFQGYPVKVNQFLPPDYVIPVSQEELEEAHRFCDRPHSRH